MSHASKNYSKSTCGSNKVVLEHCNRVDGSPRSTRDANRCGNEHEFPAFQPGGCFRNGLEIEVVEKVHPPGDEREMVYRQPAHRRLGSFVGAARHRADILRRIAA